jgi:hypothetical protein
LHTIPGRTHVAIDGNAVRVPEPKADRSTIFIAQRFADRDAPERVALPVRQLLTPGKQGHGTSVLNGEDGPKTNEKNRL